MTTMNSKEFEEICDRVWHDRGSLISGQGRLNGEVTLMRAVFWRLCKAGIETNGPTENDDRKPTSLGYQLVLSRMLELNARPPFDCAPILRELIERYQNEVGSGSLDESSL